MVVCVPEVPSYVCLFEYRLIIKVLRKCLTSHTTLKARFQICRLSSLLHSAGHCVRPDSLLTAQLQGPCMWCARDWLELSNMVACSTNEVYMKEFFHSWIFLFLKFGVWLLKDWARIGLFFILVFYKKYLKLWVIHDLSDPQICRTVSFVGFIELVILGGAGRFWKEHRSPFLFLAIFFFGFWLPFS